jgi:hypothetical protein
VAAILKMATGRYFSMSGINSGHHNLDLQLPVKSVPITSKVVSLNPAHGEVHVYPIQHLHYVKSLSVLLFEETGVMKFR